MSATTNPSFFDSAKYEFAQGVFLRAEMIRPSPGEPGFDFGKVRHGRDIEHLAHLASLRPATHSLVIKVSREVTYILLMGIAKPLRQVNIEERYDSHRDRTSDPPSPIFRVYLYPADGSDARAFAIKHTSLERLQYALRVFYPGVKINFFPA